MLAGEANAMQSKSTGFYMMRVLTHFMPLGFFATPGKHQKNPGKTSGFLMFSGAQKETTDINGLGK